MDCLFYSNSDDTLSNSVKAEMTSVAQLMRAAIFRAGIKGDSTASDRKSPESGGTKVSKALHCFDLINYDGNTSVRPMTMLGCLSLFT